MKADINQARQHRIKRVSETLEETRHEDCQEYQNGKNLFHKTIFPMYWMQIYLEISVHNIQNTTISYQKPRL